MLSPRTVVHVHRVLSEALRQAVRWGLLATNPADGSSPPRPQRPQTTVVDVAMANRILRASEGTQLELAVGLALGTGMRRGEILGLASQFLVDLLAKERARERADPVTVAGLPLNLVVRTEAGRAWNPDTLSSTWRRLSRRVGLPSVRFHDLRHAHATLMLVMGIHPKIVSERLGHSSIGITLDTYSHVLPSMQIQAAAALDELLGRTPD